MMSTSRNRAKSTKLFSRKFRLTPRRTEKQKSNQANSGHSGPRELGPESIGKDGEPQEQEARRVTGVRHRNGCSEQSLTASKNVLKGGNVLLHLQPLHITDSGPLNDVGHHLQAQEHLHISETVSHESVWRSE